jgi:hypothetical protein
MTRRQTHGNAPRQHNAVPATFEFGRHLNAGESLKSRRESFVALRDSGREEFRFSRDVFGAFEINRG